MSPPRDPPPPDTVLPDLSTGSVEITRELIETCRNYLLLVANRNLDPRLQGKFGASDLVQETFLHAQQHFSQFRGNSPDELLGWLKQILLNHLVDETRKYRDTEKRRISRELPLRSSTESRSTELEVSAGDRSPRADVIAREEAQALATAMARLPEDYRRVLHLRSWERLSFQEVGTRMGRSAEAARKLWARAVDRLQIELE